jgi:hypothetical protein
MASSSGVTEYRSASCRDYWCSLASMVHREACVAEELAYMGLMEGRCSRYSG